MKDGYWARRMNYVATRMVWAGTLYMILATLIRLMLAVYAVYVSQVTGTEAIWALSVGWMSDWVPTSYLMLLVGAATVWVPGSCVRGRGCSWLGTFAWLLLVVVLGFLSVGELLFWEEFGSRYNFIAVDYLVYTHEVLHNILESYPVAWITVGMAVLMASLLQWVRRRLGSEARRGYRALALGALACVLCDAVDLRWGWSAKNRYADELAKNGVYLLFHAFRHNELDYMTHYKTVDEAQAIRQVQKDLGISDSKHPLDALAHPVKAEGAFRPMNVVVIMVESLSYEFLSKQSQGRYLTPYLRSLSDRSLVFESHYATGTRTVRGLEAFTLSVPPTPGSSIVRRPEHAPLPTLASVLRTYGYESAFVYGGIGYFDNMNAFFKDNGYHIIDQLDIPKSRAYFSNAWGVADEILLDESLRQADVYASQGKPFFLHVMTTSNHRPFTFPERPNFPWPQGHRDSAVAYTDFAIERFMTAAQGRAWFDRTLFVITADHCASSAGKSVIDVSKYHIPWIMYAPKWLAPKRMATRTSQLDMAPTILALLNASYTSHFFGRNALNGGDSVVPLGTYQNLGLWYQDHLVVLSPKSEVACLQLSGEHSTPMSCQEDDVTRAVSWYQFASRRFSEGVMQRVMTEQEPKK